MFYKEIHTDPDFADIFHQLQVLTTANKYITLTQNILAGYIRGVLHNVDREEAVPYTLQIKAITVDLEKMTFLLREAADQLEALKETAYNQYIRKEQ